MSAAQPIVLDLNDRFFDGQTLPDALADYDHVHSTTGDCVKNIHGPFCVRGEAARVVSRPTDHDIRALIATAEDYYDVASSEANADLCEMVAKTLTWVLGEADPPSLPEPDWCSRCDGQGGWARPVEDDNGRVLDDDIDCPRCEGSRVEP